MKNRRNEANSFFKKQQKQPCTCIISGASSPHIWTPTTLSVVVDTMIFIKERSGRPEIVSFRGLKFDVKTSMSPYSRTACNINKVMKMWN